MRGLRIRTIKALICCIVLLAGGCDAGSPPSAVAPDATTEQPSPASTGTSGVTITFGAFSFMRHAYEPLIAAFNQQHPGITVQFVSLDTVYQTQSGPDERSRQIAGSADTAEVGASGEQFQQGLLYDLTPLIDSDASFDREDFYPGALSSATAAGGAIYKLPQTLNIRMLFYNKDLWATSGLAAPTPGWTWQDLEAATQQLAQKQGSTVKVYGLADDDAYLAVLLTELKTAGLDLFSTPPTSTRVDRPEVVAALERMADLFRSGAFYYPPQGVYPTQTIAQLALNQQLAMWGSHFERDIASFQERTGSPAPSFARGVALYPSFPNGIGDFTRGYVISSGTQHPQEAWTWLSFLSKQLVDDQAGGSSSPGSVSSLPARKSLAERNGYWSRLDEETRAVVQAALARPVGPSSPNILDTYQPLLQAIDEIVGGKSAAQAASEAQAALANQVAQAEQTPVAAPDAAVVVATPVPNVAPAGATTITFGMPLPKGDDLPTRLALEFNQSDQGVFVQLKDTFTGNDIMSVPEAAGQADCFASLLPPAQSELTATLDLQPLVDADPSFQSDDYPPALLTPYRQGSQLHGLPWGFSPSVLIYNKDLFDAAGLSYPTAQWTMDDFFNAAQQLTSGQGDTKRYGFVIPRGTSGGVKFLVHLLGAATTQGGGETLKPNFTDPKVVEAVRKIIDLLKNETPHTRLDDYSPASGFDNFDPLVGDGRVGMFFGWGLLGRTPPTAWHFTPGATVLPLAQAALDTDDVGISSMYISAQTDKQQACWTWLKHFGTALSPFAPFPARRSTAHSDAVNQEIPGMAAAYDAYAAALDRTGQLAPGSGPGSAIDYYWFYHAIDRALQGKNLEQELAAAQALTEQYVACARGGGQHQACAQQIDPSYQGWP